MAAVVYLREPLFVFHVNPDGKTNIEMYHLHDLHHSSNGHFDVIDSVNIDPATAFMVIATLLRNQVIPLMIAMKAGTNIAHFTALKSR